MSESTPYVKRIGLSSVYLCLVILRVLFALFGTGYIHPDEYFQNGEAIAGRILGLHTWLTWEWDPLFPIRSIVPVWITTGTPFFIARFLAQGQMLSPRVLFVAERLSFLSLSFLLDYSTYHLVPAPSRMFALVLLGSSYVTHTYQVRPFTNSIEGVLVALSLLLLKRLLIAETFKTRTQPSILAALACVAVCGLFTRITFGAFFLPIALEVLLWSLRQSKFLLLSWLQLVVPSLLIALVTAGGFMYADAAYFASPSRSSLLELTPLNFLRYNLLPTNLAEHGLHPRWLHLVVNLPMIATPGLLFYVFWAEWDYSYPRTAERSQDEDKTKRGVVETMQKVLYWLRWSSVTLLSIQPHQEPRFLTPLIVPMVALVVGNGRILRAKRLFWTVWIVSNVALAIVFGILHQGGVIPSLIRVHDIVYNKDTGVRARDFRIVYWKTYMPPLHLLAVRSIDAESKAVEVVDFAGASLDVVIRGLQRPPTTSKPLCILLVAPFHTIQVIDVEARDCFTERNRLFLHVDLDHISEAVEVGWRDGMSLGIFDVDRACLAASAQG